MKIKILLAAIVLLGASLRIFYALNLPLSGDEPISLLQSTEHTTEHIVDDFSMVLSSIKVNTLTEYDKTEFGL